MQHDEGNSQHSKATSATLKNNTRKHQTSRSTLQHYNMEKIMAQHDERNSQHSKITPATIEIYFCNITT
jgi:hypothetical protein